MCTLTWRVTQSGYQILFNRDEQKTRSIALPPQAFHKGNTVALMPIDPDGQGTWVATNNHGLSLCLLNFYQGQTPTTAKLSRGQLIRQLAYCHNYSQVVEQLAAINWKHFPPFTLVIFDPQKMAHREIIHNVDLQNTIVPVIVWDGIKVTHDYQTSPITSSSFQFEQVQAARVAHFNHQTPLQVQPNLCQLLAYHMSHSPEQGAHSVCMHRDDAKTVSLTMINVESHQVTMDYQPGSPCLSQPIVSLIEPRKITMEIEP